MSWFPELARWFADAFGVRVVVYSIRTIHRKFQHIFATRNILILGSEQTGKTSLMNLLHTGKPYEVRNGEVHPPERTVSYVVVGMRINLGEARFKVPVDVAGDPDFRGVWEAMLAKVKPAGIIYMMDGRLGRSALEKAVQEMFDDVVCHYLTPPAAAELVALHVFLNYSDKWATTETKKREKERMVSGFFDRRLKGLGLLDHLRFVCSTTQLSPHKQSWPEVKTALILFGQALRQ